MKLAGQQVLPPEFFCRSAAAVASDLIGKLVVRRLSNGDAAHTVTETEAYEGQHDLACHSANGRTSRTEVMFGPAGRFYVYRIYGLHWMLNVVTGPENEAAAVLIRGIDGVTGPGRVAAALSVDISLYGCCAAPASGLWFEKADRPDVFTIKRERRVGVDYAGKTWADKRLRFVLASYKRKL